MRPALGMRQGTQALRRSSGGKFRLSDKSHLPGDEEGQTASKMR